MSRSVRLAVCHQSRLFRECLITALRSIDQYDVVVSDDCTPDSFVPSQSDGPDVVLVDVGTPGSSTFGVVQRLLSSSDRPRMILIVSSNVPSFVESCLKAGADGCVLDEDTLDDLRDAIRSVLAGRDFCSPQAYRCLRKSAGPTASAFLGRPAREGLLTPREIDVLSLIAQRNLSNKQIARELRVSIYTVKNHVHSIIEKLSVEDRRMAVRQAVCEGLLSLPNL
jgi:DNA-binding NarL/FixJ family response regulator